MNESHRLKSCLDTSIFLYQLFRWVLCYNWQQCWKSLCHDWELFTKYFCQILQRVLSPWLRALQKDPLQWWRANRKDWKPGLRVLRKLLLPNSSGDDFAIFRRALCHDQSTTVDCNDWEHSRTALCHDSSGKAFNMIEISSEEFFAIFLHKKFSS